jgi:hypothetical protein
VIASRFLCCITLVAQAQSSNGQTAPMPNPDALVVDIEARQRKMELLREDYTFRETVQTDELDAKGGVKKTSEEEREVFYVNGHRIARLVRKNGRDLNPGEEKSEQSRIRKLIEEYVKGPRGRTTYGEAGEVGLTGILSVMTISNPRRTTLNGRGTLAYDFVGNRHAKASGMAENASKKVAGTVWIDDADRAVARLEAAFSDTFRIGGGILASVQKGTSIRIEQSRVGEGLWMRTTSEIHLGLREFLVNAVRQNIRTRDVDFRKFDIGMVSR